MLDVGTAPCNTLQRWGSEVKAVALHLNVSSGFKTDFAGDKTNCFLFMKKV